MKPKKDRFKQKGQNILNPRPNSMRDFLEDQQDAQLHKTTKPQIHKCANVQNHNDTNAHISTGFSQNTAPEELERIHVQIRKDLADKLMEMVYVRKREGKKATQRRIIEKALEEYFAK